MFLLHARNLLDFLVPRQTVQREDVIAQHFAPTWACSPRDQLAGRTIADWRNRIDKLLSHVTYRRKVLIDEMVSQERWPIEKIYVDLLMGMCEFLKTAPESRREWFGPEIRAEGGC